MAGPLQLLKKNSSVGQIVYIVSMVCQEKVEGKPCPIRKKSSYKNFL
jgi:hypothetical protein